MPFYNIKHIVSKKPKWGLVFPRLNIAASYPLFLLTHITLSCDQKCDWCYQRADRFYSLHGMNMEVGLFEKILRSFSFFKPHIHIYGGEPLLHPDFPKFLEYCRVYKYRPTLTTNGKYLDKYSGVIRNSTLSQLNISLNGFLDSNGNISLESGKTLKEFIKANKGIKKINLNYAVGSDNCACLVDVLSHFNNSFRKGDFSYFVIQHRISNDTPGIRADEVAGIGRFSEILREIRNMKLKFKLIFLPHIKAGDLESYYATDHPFKDECYIPWVGLSILPDAMITPGGGVFGCNFVLGNLKESSVMKIWKGTSLNNFRSELIRKKLPVSCNRCCHKLYY